MSSLGAAWAVYFESALHVSTRVSSLGAAVAGYNEKTLSVATRVSSLGAGLAVSSQGALRLSDRASSLGGAVAQYWRISRDLSGPWRGRRRWRSEDGSSYGGQGHLMRRRIEAWRATARMHAETAAFPPMGQIGSVKCRQLLGTQLWQRT